MSKIQKLKEKANVYKDIGKTAKLFLKGTIVEKIADGAPDIGTGTVYAAADTFGLVAGGKILKDFAVRELIEGQPYFDFSNTESTAISLGKMALTAISIGFGYSTIKRGVEYFRDR